MIYEPNPKHKYPWQPGRKGSLCPWLSPSEISNLLAGSTLFGKKRYAVLNGRPYCAQEHETGKWHGYPVEWNEVPPAVRREWLEHKIIRRRDLKRKTGL